MTTSGETLRRAADLKGMLVEFVYSDKQASRYLGRSLERRFGSPMIAEEHDLIDAVDSFVLRERLPNGRTVLEQFCRRRYDLSDTDRETLLGWHDVVEGIFEVEARVDRDGVLQTRNVSDELEYRIVSNCGPATLAPAQRRGFLVARIVPLGTGDWMVSGVCSLQPRSSRPHLLRLAAAQAMDRPELVLRNPEKLALAWQLQHHDRELFLEFFGTDLIVIPGRDVQQRWDEYWQWQLAQPVAQAERHPVAQHVTQPAVEFDLTDELRESETVGIIYDETEGLTFLAEFEKVRAVFTDPDLAALPDYRHTVLGYLHDDSVSTLPFRRLAEPSAERASRAFARLLNRPKFSWERDGEALMRKYKPNHVDREPRPQIVPLGSDLVRAMQAA